MLFEADYARNYASIMYQCLAAGVVMIAKAARNRRSTKARGPEVTRGKLVWSSGEDKVKGWIWNESDTGLLVLFVSKSTSYFKLERQSMAIYVALAQLLR